MLASPVPIYLGCAGLIVGSLGLGAQYLIGGNPGSATNASEPPLFAQSVEEATLPAERWTSQNRGVAHYAPMVELMTTSARSNEQPSEPSNQATERAQEQPREAVRDLSKPQTRQSRRAKNQRNRNEMREETAASAEQVDPREVRAQATRKETRGQERRYRDRGRDEAEVVEPRSRSDRRRVERDDRRLRDDDRRVVIREEIREPEQRIVRGPEREFSPFGLFGIFDQR